MAEPARPKVFGIGLNKTGTTTLQECGRRLGYTCAPYRRPLLELVSAGSDLGELDRFAANYDFFEDWPWPLVYEHLDDTFPDAKFVLTLRASEKVWLRSLEQYSLTTHPFRHSRKLAYGRSYPQRNRAYFLDFYRRHNDAVREHFADRPDKLLEICWEDGGGLADLADFLGCAHPTDETPHVNRAGAHQASPRRRAANRLLSLVVK